MTDRVVVHGFDTFAGLPECQDAADESLIGGRSGFRHLRRPL